MEPLKLSQAKDHVAQILRNQIYSGVISDGEELAQEALAENLGVSRMPVREAMQLLESEGLLERLPNRHMRVIGMKKDNIFHNIRALSALESEIAAMLLAEGKDVSILADFLKEYEEAVSEEMWGACPQKELAFHMQISKLLGDKYLIQLHQKIINGYFSYVLKYSSIDWRNNLSKLYEILYAIENKKQTSLREAFDNYFKEITEAVVKEG